MYSVLWYTAMLGKKSSLKTLLKILKAEGIKNVRTTRFDPVRASTLYLLRYFWWIETMCVVFVFLETEGQTHIYTHSCSWDVAVVVHVIKTSASSHQDTCLISSRHQDICLISSRYLPHLIKTSASSHQIHSSHISFLIMNLKYDRSFHPNNSKSYLILSHSNQIR